MIKNGKVVNITYTLKNDSGEVLDQANASDPFTYLHGSHQIVSGLEAALLGLKIGDTKSVTVPPAEGYGELNPDLKLSLERSRFPKGAKIHEGMQFATQSDDGHEIVFTVEKVDGDNIHLDGNHPLAGQTLHFAVEVLSVRDATEEELAHGHAHGPGGHH